MSEVCNKIALLNEDQLDAKASFARAGSTSVLAAMSEFYRAAEMLEARGGSLAGSEAVYLRSASVKLEAAGSAFSAMREVLASAPPREGAIDWLRCLDFDRLYEEGTREGLIPSSSEQWSRLVRINVTQGYLQVADALIGDIRNLQRRTESLIERLEATQPTGLSATVVGMYTAFVNYAAFAQMVAYVNALVPLDPAWSREPSGTAAVSGAG